MFTFLTDGHDVLHGAPLTPFLAFFAYVWMLWAAKSLAARRYRPSDAPAGELTTTVIVPVFRESQELFRRVLASAGAHGPTGVIAGGAGGDRSLVDVASELCDRVLAIPKSGKRAAIAAGLGVSDPGTDRGGVPEPPNIWGD